MENIHSQQAINIQNNLTSPRSTLYLSIAAPGKGKTKSLIDNLPLLLKSNGKVLIALPTIDLSSSIKERISSTFPEYEKKVAIINTDEIEGASVTLALESKLRDTFFSIVICTHKALVQVDSSLLARWTVVLDEVPRCINYWGAKLKQWDQARITEFADIVDSRLRIRKRMKTCLMEQLQTYMANDSDSTLSDTEKALYEALLNDIPVIAKDSEDSTGKRLYCYVDILPFDKIILSAKETHLLCANFKGSEFEGLCNFWNIDRRKSYLTPIDSKYSNSRRVTIYPLLGTIDESIGEREVRFSRYIAHKIIEEGILYDKGTGKKGGNLITHLLKKVKDHVGDSELLLIKNSKQDFKRSLLKNVKVLPVDTRGLNEYSESQNCLILFAYNYQPYQDEFLFPYMEEISGITAEEWKQRYSISNTYEMALQAVTRTNIREDGNSNLPVKIYVPDWHHVRYLKKTLVHAQIDTSLIYQPVTAIKTDDKRRIPDWQRDIIIQVATDNPTMSKAKLCKLVELKIEQESMGLTCLVSRQLCSKIWEETGLIAKRSYRKTG